MKDLPALLDRLEQAGGPADPVPSADGWELVLAENIAYLVDDRWRWQALAKLRTEVGLAPEQILAAPEDVLRGIVSAADRHTAALPANADAVTFRDTSFGLVEVPDPPIWPSKRLLRASSSGRHDGLSVWHCSCQPKRWMRFSERAGSDSLGRD